jgi:hypothetical protein
VPDLLAYGSAWLEDQRHRHLTTPVTYQRGSRSVQLQATIGQTVFRIDGELGAVIHHVRRDYLIRAIDLVLPPEVGPTLPQRGDQIVDGNGVVYEVMGPGGGEPDWRYSDPQRQTLRIHSKEIAQP